MMLHNQSAPLIAWPPDSSDDAYNSKAFLVE